MSEKVIELNIGSLKPAPGSKHKRVRKGCGASSRKGRSCGRGRGGSGHRSGSYKRKTSEGGQMPLIRRVTKRGFSNKKFAEKYEIVNILQLQNKFKGGESVTPEKLKEKNIPFQIFKIFRFSNIKDVN